MVGTPSASRSTRTAAVEPATVRAIELRQAGADLRARVDTAADDQDREDDQHGERKAQDSLKQGA